MLDLPYGPEVWHGAKVLSVLWADDGRFERCHLRPWSMGKPGTCALMDQKMIENRYGSNVARPICDLTVLPVARMHTPVA